MLLIVKYLFNSSKVAEHPPRLATGQRSLRLSLSYQRMYYKTAGPEPRIKGRICGRIINRACDHQSISLRKLHRQLFTTSSNTHFPSSAHRLQAIHPLTASLPTCTISASTPSFQTPSSSHSTRSMYFHSPRGLPLIINTFIIYPPHSTSKHPSRVMPADIMLHPARRDLLHVEVRRR